MNMTQSLRPCLALALIGLLLTACQDDETATDPIVPQVQLATDGTFGQYLVDQEGNTLYFFSQDVSGTSLCTDGCSGAWPVFQQDVTTVGEGLDPADFDTIAREGGAEQSTYKGWPLYRFQGDSQPGEINGDGQNGQWFIAKPDYSVMLAHQVIEGLGDTLTQYIVDPGEKTLYYYFPDDQDVSTCSASCIAENPAFFGGDVDNLILPSGLGLDEFDLIVRDDGTTQSTYKRRPMYRHILDDVRGSFLSHTLPDWTVARVVWAKPGG